MMRNKTSSSLQKTYDECYLVCSTAVYFEHQGNEAEALRSWRSALDQIYYYNACRAPANYKPRSEIEKTLQESLRDMEIQCKERVDLLEALKQSRLEQGPAEANKAIPQSPKGKLSKTAIKFQEESHESDNFSKGSIGNGTIPATCYSDLSRPPLPQRPYQVTRTSSESAAMGKDMSNPSILSSSSLKSSVPNITLAMPDKRGSRNLSSERSRAMLTTLRPGRSDKKVSSGPSSIFSSSGGERPVPSKAATLAWSSVSKSGRDRLGRGLDTEIDNSSVTSDSVYKSSISAPKSLHTDFRGDITTRRLLDEQQQPENHLGLLAHSNELYDLARDNDYSHPETESGSWEYMGDAMLKPPIAKNNIDLNLRRKSAETKHAKSRNMAISHSLAENFSGNSKPIHSTNVEEGRETSAEKSSPTDCVALPIQQHSSSRTHALGHPKLGPSRVMRKPAPNISSPRYQDKHLNRDEIRRVQQREAKKQIDIESFLQGADDESEYHSQRRQKKTQTNREAPILPDPITPVSDELNIAAERTKRVQEEKVAFLSKSLPKGIDETMAKQILCEIMVKGDEVHWEDIAGLEIAKTALKEAVVYPFLRPDLFMGLREPVSGMLLFGPPGTGKTMLARAVATESRSIFFSISASSLTSKYLGESEKLVRALFSLAKSLAPSIIFVDEIDSLLSSRSGSGENEATRRIKTEFLIQWSDLQRAAAGREKEKGDASRVLVLAATNLPWAIDEAARRRFVRRQYIPLPEAETRATQLRNLLGHQKHTLDEQDIQKLVRLTEGFSGSDITALAKDAAMGPLRALGEALLSTSMDQIRPMELKDFEASLDNIRPSVSRQGLKQFEDWAKEFGERGG